IKLSRLASTTVRNHTSPRPSTLAKRFETASKTKQAAPRDLNEFDPERPSKRASSVVASSIIMARTYVAASLIALANGLWSGAMSPLEKGPGDIEARESAGRGGRRVAVSAGLGA